MKRLTLAATVFAGLAATVSSAALADIKIYSAASCRVPVVSNATVNTNGVVLNQSFTLALNISCPLLRDHPSLKPTSIAVSVVDNSSLLVGDGAISCRVVAVNRFGTQASAGVTAVTSGTNSAGTTLSLPIPATVLVDGTYMVNCKIPRRGVGDPASTITSIKVTEPNE